MPQLQTRQRRSQSPEQVARTRRRHMLLLSLLVFVVFASTLGGGFVWTDREDLLLGEHRLQGIEDIPAALTQTRDAFRDRHATGDIAAPGTGSWQPLTLLSNTLSWALWGECGLCFHLENLLLHLVVVIGLYALGRHILDRRRHGTAMAAWAAAIYAVHPATVPSVAWIGGRPYLLAAALAVWSLVLFTRLQATTKSHGGPARHWQIGMALTAAVAMLAHETAYLLPLLALLIAGYESKERGRSAVFGIAPIRWIALGQLSAVLALILLYRTLVFGGLGFGGSYPAESLLDNLGTALRHFWYLFELTLLPSEPVISDAWQITRGWGVAEILALLILLVLLTVVLVGLKFGHPAAFGVGWMILWLIPGVGIFPSDHYHSSQTLYLAAWGIALPVAFGLFRLWRPIGRQLVPGSEAVVYAPLLLFLGVMTTLSNARWWTHDGLFESEVASDPHYREGRVELAKSALARGDADKAMNYAMAALEASQNDSFTGYWSPRDTYFVLARAQWELGMATEAVRNFDTALEQRPDDAEILYWRGVSRIALGEFEGAEADLKKALTLRQGFPDAEADLGVLFAEQGRYTEAYPLLAAAFESGLGGYRRHVAMARAMIDAEQLADAADQLERALAIREDPDERARLAWVSWKLGRTEKAMQDLNMALQFEETTSEFVRQVMRELTAAPAATTGD